MASRDGTEIARTSGSGPPIVLVHGSPADHARWHPLIPYLEHHVAAVVDAIAATTGETVDIYGHSRGGIVAFGAATLTAHPQTGPLRGLASPGPIDRRPPGRRHEADGQTPD